MMSSKTWMGNDRGEYVNSGGMKLGCIPKSCRFSSQDGPISLIILADLTHRQCAASVSLI